MRDECFAQEFHFTRIDDRLLPVLSREGSERVEVLPYGHEDEFVGRLIERAADALGDDAGLRADERDGRLAKETFELIALARWTRGRTL